MASMDLAETDKTNTLSITSDLTPSKNLPARASLMGLQVHAKEGLASAIAAMPDVQPPDDTPPRASFMGLPAELRLRIYAFIFNGSDSIRTEHPHEYLTSRDELEPHKSDVVLHCCTQPGPSLNGHKPPSRDILCLCSGATYPQMLRLNRQIFNEAVPEFYSRLEVRVALPSRYFYRCPLRHAKDSGRPDSIEYLFTRIPGYGLPHVTKLLLVTSTFATCIPTQIFDTRYDPDPLVEVWKTLAIRTPKVQSLRLHFDANPPVHHQSFTTSDIAGMVAALPKLTRVRVDMSRCKYGDEVKDRMTGRLEKASLLERKIVSIIQEAANVQWRSLEVTSGPSGLHVKRESRPEMTFMEIMPEGTA